MNLYNVLCLASFIVLIILTVTCIFKKKLRLFGFGVLFAMLYQYLFTTLAHSSWYKFIRFEHSTVIAWILFFVTTLFVWSLCSRARR